MNFCEFIYFHHIYKSMGTFREVDTSLIASIIHFTYNFFYFDMLYQMILKFLIQVLPFHQNICTFIFLPLRSFGNPTLLVYGFCSAVVPLIQLYSNTRLFSRSSYWILKILLWLETLLHSFFCWAWMLHLFHTCFLYF